MIPKYRAWHIAENKMYPIMKIDLDDEDVMVDREVYGWPKDRYQILLFSEIILMQSTGLHDLAKIEIFDGDIVKSINPNITVPGVIDYSVSDGEWNIIYKFDAEDIFIDPLGHFHLCINVVGNIHANPELLKGNP